MAVFRATYNPPKNVGRVAAVMKKNATPLIRQWLASPVPRTRRTRNQ